MRTIPWILATVAVALAGLAGGCGKPLLAPERPTKLDVPPYLSDTICQHARVAGLEPVMVQGIGLVTGLDGTGSTIHPPGIRDRILKEMNRRRVPDPERLLASRTTAVVSITGFIPPGCRVGERFDLSVQPMPGTDASSLEGGMLMETELVRVELGRAGAGQGQTLAMAAGPIFVSPFTPADTEAPTAPSKPRPVVRDSSESTRPEPEPPQAHRLLGVILGGGRALYARNFFLQLINPSERTAEMIVRHINARFPPEGKNIAKGNIEPDTVDLLVPAAYGNDKARFLNIVSSLYLIEDPAQRDLRMRELVERLRQGEDPTAVTAALEAFGMSVVPLLTPLLEDEQPHMRFYAARTLAVLKRTDCLAALEKFVADDRSPFQEAAVRALAELPRGSGAAIILKALHAENPTTRIAAYLMLERVAPHLVPSVQIPDRFTLAVVPSRAKPFIFVSRQDRPRVVIFGDVSIEPPLLVNTPRFLASVGRDETQMSLINKKFGAAATVRTSLLLADVVSAMARPTSVTDRDRKPNGLELSYSDVVMFIDRAIQEGAVTAPLRLEPIRFIGPAGDQPLPELGEPEIIPIPDR